MKVYTKIVYDKDDNIIEEDSYNYDGPVAQARMRSIDGKNMGPMQAKAYTKKKR